MIWLAALAVMVVWFVIESSRRSSHPVNGGLQPDIHLPHTAPFELYSNSFSHCSRKVRFALAELGIEHTHHHIDLIETGWYQTISPGYLRINRSGLVPTLVHDGHPVYESDDILKFAHTHSAVNLAPAEYEQEIDRWLAFCHISSAAPMQGMVHNAGPCIPGLTLPLFITSIRHIPLHRILTGLLFHSDRKRPTFFALAKLLGLKRTLKMAPIQKMLPPAREAMRRHLTTLNDALEKSPTTWLVGDTFSLADVTVGVMLLRLDETGWLAHFTEAAGLSALQSYYAAIQARPGWDVAITDHQHPIIVQASAELHTATRDPEIAQLLYGR